MSNKKEYTFTISRITDSPKSFNTSVVRALCNETNKFINIEVPNTIVNDKNQVRELLLEAHEDLITPDPNKLKVGDTL